MLDVINLQKGWLADLTSIQIHDSGLMCGMCYDNTSRVIGGLHKFKNRPTPFSTYARNFFYITFTFLLIRNLRRKYEPLVCEISQAKTGGYSLFMCSISCKSNEKKVFFRDIFGVTSGILPCLREREREMKRNRRTSCLLPFRHKTLGKDFEKGTQMS